MKALVGYTGFVGSNIYASGNIDKGYNTKNIKGAYGTKPDLLIYAGLKAEKYLANTNPVADMETILQAEENINLIKPKKLVLISTIDIFKKPVDVDEESDVDTNNLHAYGLNRYRLEQWVRDNYPESLIIRLPGLYGINLKKNFIYDFINIIPSMLGKDKFRELSEREPGINRFYTLLPNGFYKCRELSNEEKIMLKDNFKWLGFTALNFTDSRSIYQFYPLSRLWDDIQIAMAHNLRIWHPATEPISAGELYKDLTGENFVNSITNYPVNYNYKTKFASYFGGENGYLMSKNQIMSDIKKFINACQ